MIRHKFKMQGAKPYSIFSLTCACDADRIIADEHNCLFCAECGTKLEGINGGELPEYDQQEIELKLKISHRVKKRT